MKYHGVADCYGIESFRPYRKSASYFLFLRAEANRHRHAVYYEAEVSEEDVRKIENLLKGQKYEEALKYLKKNGIITIPRRHLKSWKLIPNPELDPYG